MRYFIIAGEASGDLHASDLMRELKNQDSAAEFCFLGGDLMQAQGGKMIKHYRRMAFMGFVAVIKNFRTVLNNMKDCKNAILDFRPDVVILVDYPSFNLRIARFVKENLDIPVYYYISPKIWAWKEYRIERIKKYVDKMFTIFPFETEFYARHNYPVEYVGNPLVDAVSLRTTPTLTFKEFCSANDLSGKPVIALLPGSRRQEITDCLQLMIESATQFSGFQVVVSGAPGINPDFYAPYINNKNVSIVYGQTYALVQHARAAIVNSGTATLETALIGTPQVVVYHQALGRIAWLLKEIVIKVKFISLVNLVAGKEVVKELIAHLFTVPNMSRELEKLLNDENYRSEMMEEYARIQQLFGKPGAAARAAASIYKALAES